VRIACELGRQSRNGRAREIVGHHRRRAAGEGERRGEHAPVADRHELRDPRPGLRLEQPESVSIVGEVDSGVA
jgi:hypothetical protein